ncbi:MAG: HNH endonuclease, partial [Oscillospiraceae bacterium]
MLMKFCARCKSMINQGRAYCDECQIEINKTKTEYKKINKAKYDKKYDLIKRDLITDKFYHSTKWKTLRAVKLSQSNYLCEDCKKKNKITIAVDVHHIIPIKKDWSKRLDINN